MSGRVLFSLFAISAQNRRAVFFPPFFSSDGLQTFERNGYMYQKLMAKMSSRIVSNIATKVTLISIIFHIYVLINKLILYTSPIFMQCILFFAIKIKSEVSWVLQQKKLLFSLICQSEWHQTITRWGGSVWGLYHLHCFCNYTCFCHVNYAIVF